MSPPKTPTVLALRILLLMTLLGFGTWGMLTGFPVAQISPAQMDYIGWFRLTYGLLFAFRLQQSLPGVSLVLGWRRADQVTRIYHVWTVLCFCLAAGFLTPLMLVIHWVLLITVQRHNKAYSVEDVLNRLPGFGLLFMNSHLGLSTDKTLGWDYGLTSMAPTGVNFFIWTFLAIMFGTGYEKLWSPLWRKGLGFYQFISIPYTSRPWFRALRKYRFFCILLSWTSLILELGLIFTSLHRGSLILGSAASVIFGLSLAAGVTPFFFVGAATVWGSAFVMVMAATVQEVSFIPPSYPGWLLLALYWIGCVSLMNFTSIRGSIVGKLMLLTTHMRPYVLFNEVHYFGLYIFRVIAITPQGRKDALELFTDDGLPGPLQPFRPVALYASFTRLTDYCIAIIHEQSQRLAFFGPVIEDIGWAAMKRLPKEIQTSMTDLRLEVRVYDPPADYDCEACPWRTGWVDIGHYQTNDGNVHFIQEGQVPHYGKTARWPVHWN